VRCLGLRSNSPPVAEVFRHSAGPKIFDSDFDESSEDDVDAKPTERVLTPGGDGPKSAAAVLKRRGAVSSGSTPQVDSFTLELPSVRKGDGDRARLKETLVNGTRYSLHDACRDAPTNVLLVFTT
jgi:hypothetical protein